MRLQFYCRGLFSNFTQIVILDNFSILALALLGLRMSALPFSVFIHYLEAKAVLPQFRGKQNYIEPFYIKRDHRTINFYFKLLLFKLTQVMYFSPVLLYYIPSFVLDPKSVLSTIQRLHLETITETSSLQVSVGK